MLPGPGPPARLLSVPTAARLPGVLTDDPQRTPPARGTGPQPGGTQRSSHRKRTSPMLFVIPVVLVVVAVGLFLVLRGGGAKGLNPFKPDQPEPVPAFDFQVGEPTVEATSDATDPQSLTAPAKHVSNDVVPVIDQLYTDGFLDPNLWKDGSYDTVWALFDGDAAATAQASVETLTLGANAGDVYDSVEPRSSGLKLKVLFDADGKPVSAVGIVHFKAYATGSDGTYSLVISKGQYFLNETGDGWRIYSFQVKRADQPANPPKPAPSASGSPSS